LLKAKLATIYLALGSNIGDRLVNLAKARALLEKVVCLIKVSSVYQTAPWGYAQQEDFYNQVISAQTSLKPKKLLRSLKRIEKRLGREKTFRNGPRVIDIDILFYDDLIFKSRRIQIPHARLEERAFVLEPLAEIAPGLIHPVLKKSAAELLSQVDTGGVKLVC
ncbi:MAG: 2-amino-4-hydroxy-6-hydroxymethyldihydropteridine diphosphokinase, partial [Anaerolineaceae bacterium]|nr:2-amino-4-hydroxy-6-hydroxymethyldihydropteridine diphosphokinase [Anaerolineaceae bacterium]